MTRILVVAVGAVVAAALAASAFKGPAPAATVAGEPISRDELRRRVQPLTRTTSFKEDVGAQDGNVAAVRHLVQQRVLTQMIRERVIADAAEDLGVTVSERGMERYIDGVMRDRELRSERELRRLLEANGLTPQEWRRLVRVNVLEDKVRERIQRAAVPPDGELRTYYRDHPSDFSRTRVQHILVRDRGLAARIHDRLATAPAGRMDGLFAELARRHSIDPSTKHHSGDLGFVAPGSFGLVVPRLDEVIAGLDPGQVAPPARSKLGFHVVRVVARKTAPFEAVRGEIEAELRPEVDPFHSFLTEAYGEVEVAERFGVLDSNFKLIDPPGDGGG